MRLGRSLVAIALGGCTQVLGLDPTERRDGRTVSPDAPDDVDCTSCPRLVANWHFEGDLADATGAHPAMAVGEGLGYAPDEAGTGMALYIPTGGTGYAFVADSPAFDLPAGRVTLRFHVGATSPTADLGLVSRDANGTTTGGHLTLRVSYNRRVVLRIQRMSDPQVSAFRCTADPLTAGWHDVEAEFGPGGLVLRVDGAVATGTTHTNQSGTVLACTDPWTLGIDGNDNPWVIGALTAVAVEGTGQPVGSIAADVSIDEIAIWELP